MLCRFILVVVFVFASWSGIRAQGASPSPLDPLILAVDVGPVRYKRVLNKMLDAEH